MSGEGRLGRILRLVEVAAIVAALVLSVVALVRSAPTHRDDVDYDSYKSAGRMKVALANYGSRPVRGLRLERPATGAAASYIPLVNVPGCTQVRFATPVDWWVSGTFLAFVDADGKTWKKFEDERATKGSHTQGQVPVFTPIFEDSPFKISAGQKQLKWISGSQQALVNCG